MKKYGAMRLATLGFALLANGVAAHHSVSGQFDMNKRTTITGTVTKVDWINPHIYVYLDVVDDNGEVATWRLESLPTAMLRKAGLTSQLIMGDGGKANAPIPGCKAWLLTIKQRLPSNKCLHPTTPSC